MLKDTSISVLDVLKIVEKCQSISAPTSCNRFSISLAIRIKHGVADVDAGVADMEVDVISHILYMHKPEATYLVNMMEALM